METQFNLEDAYGAIKLDGFDNCIIGIVEEFGNGPRILYSKEKIINELCEEMTMDEALEFYDFNNYFLISIIDIGMFYCSV